jgi:hypothetical protein
MGKKDKKKYWKAELVEGFHPIMIDVEVHKAIEAARESFSEMPNTILRRMLGIGGVSGGPARPPEAVGQVDAARQAGSARPNGPARPRAKGGVSGADGWSKLDRSGRDIFLPNGTELRAAYAGQAVTGTIAEGEWQVGGERYGSPSAALIANVRARSGQPVNLNGWRHWEVKLPGSPVWRPLVDV